MAFGLRRIFEDESIPIGPVSNGRTIESSEYTAWFWVDDKHFSVHCSFDRVIVCLHETYKHKQTEFEYADPKFPDNLVDWAKSQIKKKYERRYGYES